MSSKFHKQQQKARYSATGTRFTSRFVTQVSLTSLATKSRYWYSDFYINVVQMARDVPCALTGASIELRRCSQRWCADGRERAAKFRKSTKCV